MNRKKELLKNTVIIAIGQILTRAVSFFLLPLYTAILNTEEYGTVDLVSNTSMLLVPIVSLELHDSVFRFLIEARSEKKRTKIIISNALFSIIISSLIYVLLSLISTLRFEPYYIFFLTLLVLSTTFSSFFRNISRGIGDNKWYAISSTVTGISTIILNIFFIVVLDLRAGGMLAALIISNFLGALVILIKYRSLISLDLKHINKPLIQSLLAYSLPMIPNVLSWWIFNSSDRYIIALVLGVASNGIYAVANKFPAILIAVFNIFNLTTTESISLHYDDEDRDYFISETVNTLSDFTMALIHGLILVLPFILPFFVNAQYSESFAQIPILALAVYPNIRSALLGTVYVAEKKTGRAAVTSAGAAALNIIVNLLLIKSIGLYAASVSTLVAYLGLLIFRTIDIKKYVYVKRSVYKSAILVILTVAVFFIYYYGNKIVNLLAILPIFLIHVYLNREFILNTIKAIKAKRSN